MNALSHEIVETGGRFRWVATFRSSSVGRIFSRDSAVSFVTRAEAQRDFDVIARLTPQQDDTFVRPKEDIDDLLAAALKGRSACAEFIFSNVQWQDLDEVGCNWCFEHFSYEIVGCVGQILSEIDALRRMYRIPFTESPQHHSRLQ